MRNKIFTAIQQPFYRAWKARQGAAAELAGRWWLQGAGRGLIS